MFAVLNLGAMVLLSGGDGGTIPFHFIWVSLTIVYGFTVWAVRPTVVVLAVVVAATTAAILLEVGEGPTRPDELAEVPLMAAMFVAMVWHARRRVARKSTRDWQPRAGARVHPRRVSPPEDAAGDCAGLCRARSRRESPDNGRIKTRAS